MYLVSIQFNGDPVHAFFNRIMISDMVKYKGKCKECGHIGNFLIDQEDMCSHCESVSSFDLIEVDAKQSKKDKLIEELASEFMFEE